MTTDTVPLFQDVQRHFLAHLRNPEHHPLPAGFDQQGADVYADLLYNKFSESLEVCFPVVHDILGETAWQQLLKAFIAEHRCLSPYYRQIPDEFIAYLQAERINNNDPAYLLELAHFEWIEMKLAITDAEPVVASVMIGVNEWLDSRPVFTPVLALLQYTYPVQRINLTDQPDSPLEQATHILGFRDAHDDVQFIELNPATARLLELLDTTEFTVREAIQQIATELQHPESSELFGFAVETLTQLLQQGAILGAQKDLEYKHG